MGTGSVARTDTAAGRTSSPRCLSPFFPRGLTDGPFRWTMVSFPTTREQTDMPASTRVPDAAGRFGPFGGRYVPETLTRALDELAAEYEKAVADPTFHEELAELYRHYVGRPSPLYFAERLTRTVRRGPDLSETRRPQPHRRPQDQQHARPGPADPPHGQAARDRRDRRRPARRGHRHGLRPLRAGMRRLHGRGRHPPAAAQRVQHEAAGGRGPAGHAAARARCATPSTRPSATG